ncbi:MAG: hypothetical protein WA783_02115 [Phormidesmis sp.]
MIVILSSWVRSLEISWDEMQTYFWSDRTLAPIAVDLPGLLCGAQPQRP